MKKLGKNAVAIISIIFIVLIGVGIYFLIGLNEDKDPDKKEEVKQGNTTNFSGIDVNSKTRPFAVMINNHSAARANHAGLQDAYIIYEMIVEGGLTRYLALFKDVDVEKIGSVRSARHYFIDYALENDAIYVHWGWSPQAQADISKYQVNNVDGLAYEGIYFYRDTDLDVAYEHTGFTTTSMLEKAAEKLNYNRDTNKPLLLDYSTESVDYSNLDGVKDATNVSIRYSSSVTSSYEYDAENKVYKRFVNGKVHKDAITGKQYTFKNIITYQVYNSNITGDDKGRQDFDNLGSGEGYLITEGKAIPIKWSKDKRENQTKYTYLNGEEIVVNDGNTFIQIQPTGQDLVIE